jgi:hypothetical protein
MRPLLIALSVGGLVLVGLAAIVAAGLARSERGAE